ncbi:Protein M05D6.5 b [Aphelenchoides avenae]|nr:Protein M05D6.5 b [Aphelenchus avenae]
MVTREEYDETKKRDRKSGVPLIPADIGFQGGKQVSGTGGSHSTGITTHAQSNPGVILGMGLTTLAILGMMRKLMQGDRMGMQKMAQYRIMAQFFTVLALAAGFVYVGVMQGIKEDEEEKKANAK